MVDSSIALPLANLSDQRLDIADARLDLNADDGGAEPQQYIPRAPVTWVRQKHFPRGAEVGRQASEETRGECLLSAISNGFAAWVQRSTEVEAEN